MRREAGSLEAAAARSFDFRERPDQFARVIVGRFGAGSDLAGEHRVDRRAAGQKPSIGVTRIWFPSPQVTS